MTTVRDVISLLRRWTVVAGKTTLQSQQIRQLQMQKRPGQVQIQGQQKVTGNLSCVLQFCLVDVAVSVTTFNCDEAFNMCCFHAFVTRQCREMDYVFGLIIHRICSSGQILLPRYLMNGLSNLSETSLAPDDDLIRFWRSRGQRSRSLHAIEVATASTLTLDRSSPSSSYKLTSVACC